MQLDKKFKLNQFKITDKILFQPLIDSFQPISCEYNFANLFVWQYVSKLTWMPYRERILIYDDIEQCSFMPLGKECNPHELIELSQSLKNMGLSPDFSLATSKHLKKFPEIEKFYIIKKKRDYAEYIYDVNKLSALQGKKLNKKRNLISQFKRKYPEFKVYPLKQQYKNDILKLVKGLINRQKSPSITLVEEYEALKLSLDYFNELDINGLVIILNTQIIAFSIFTRLNHLIFDIQFEKTDLDFKGASQMINLETAKYLKNKCQYLNREQDLGIKGLRKAKMSYAPCKIMVPYTLSFKLQ